PLIFSGEILGFWAFVVASSQQTNLATLLPAVKSFAGEIAEILHKRQQWLLEEKRSQSLSGRLLRLDPKEDVYDSVNHTLSLLGRRLSVLDLVFNALDASIVLYNIFGQVTHVNQRMAEILKQMNIAVFKMSALDLAVKLTDHTMEEMRGILSQTIINHETATLHVTLADAKRSYLLSLRPLVGKEEHFGRDEAYPFNLQGILFEMIDITDIRDFSRLKSELFEKSNAHLQDSVESMGNVCMLLEDDNLISDEKSALITEMEGRKKNIQKFMDELNSYMEKDNFSNDYHIFPLSAGKLLNEAAADLEEKAWTRKVTITIPPSPLSDLVMAAPADVKELCTALLTVLVEDAYDNTAVSVSLTPSDSHYTFTMTNSGYGMPNEDFQRYLTSSSLTDSKAFKKIHQIFPRLGIWEGDLTGSSQVGEGIEFRLRLIRFQ
ncbi:MAG TPA: hypothetical protein VJ936_02865, partial [Desulfobacteraceae bacterium]|nr:hypothetical protein [Desulfobacteraceae bacterium]